MKRNLTVCLITIIGLGLVTPVKAERKIFRHRTIPTPTSIPISKPTATLIPTPTTVTQPTIRPTPTILIVKLIAPTPTITVTPTPANPTPTTEVVTLNQKMIYQPPQPHLPWFSFHWWIMTPLTSLLGYVFNWS
jgi:hypothetical protein